MQTLDNKSGNTGRMEEKKKKREERKGKKELELDHLAKEKMLYALDAP